MSDARISYDILTLIIDQLAAEHRFDELNACSQTCRMLLHPCRVHLFSTVKVDKSTFQFVALLKGNSTIPNYIQELTYHTRTMSKDLANAFLLLNNIKTFNLYGHKERDWRSLSPRTRHAFAHFFSSPSMSRFYAHNIGNLPATLLSSCSTLKHLTLSECHVSSSVVCDNILGTPPQLLSLALSNDYFSGLGNDLDTVMEDLLKMKRASGLPILNFSGLRSLIVYIYDNLQEKHFENILRLTPKLDYMQCSVLHGATPDSWAQKLAIVSPTLRSLKLNWNTYNTATNIAFFGLIKILETLTHQPNCINELFLILLTERSDSDILGLDWELLDRLLADRSGFPRLEKLTIQLCSRHRYDWDNSKAGIEAGFKKTKTTKFSRLFMAANDYLDFKFEVHD